MQEQKVTTSVLKSPSPKKKCNKNVRFHPHLVDMNPLADQNVFDATLTKFEKYDKNTLQKVEVTPHLNVIIRK